MTGLSMNGFGRRGGVVAMAGLALLALTGTGPARAQDWLVTPDEVARSAAVPMPVTLVARAAGAPAIEVLRPLLEGNGTQVVSPVPIELRFKPAADAAIDVASFRVLYGAFRIDVTQRLLKSVVVRPDGLKVEQAAIPSGSHRLVVQVTDTLGRQGSRELNFSVP
ncbi:hypothetical protein [Ideonella margarita]|uniref:Ig-like domain-containing protein n=1 Tax=Ideonella margarita TaxID=2984191 RepID=A0ABU9C5U6_9BURK